MSCEPIILTFTRTSEPAYNTFPGVVPTAFLLKIFSTAVNPRPEKEISLDGANTDGIPIPKVLAANVCTFFQNTIEYEPPALINSIFCGVNAAEISLNSVCPL